MSYFADFNWNKHTLLNVLLSTGYITGRTPSLREQMSSSLYTSAPVPVPPTNVGGPPRTLFGRLGIRKPSLLSLTSPLVPPAPTARTFSLDDLLKPPPRSKKHPVPRLHGSGTRPCKCSHPHSPLLVLLWFTLPPRRFSEGLKSLSVDLLTLLTLSLSNGMLPKINLN